MREHGVPSMTAKAGPERAEGTSAASTILLQHIFEKQIGFIVMIESIFDDVVILISILRKLIVLGRVVVGLIVAKRFILIDGLPAQGRPLGHSCGGLAWATFRITFVGSELRQILIDSLPIGLSLAHVVVL